MARTTPVVRGGILYVSVGEDECQILVGTPAWYAWLEEVSTFAFSSNTGTFTARKETKQQGRAYWKAYRKREGKLHRVYLGKSEDLTLERLNTAATVLAGTQNGVDTLYTQEEGATGGVHDHLFSDLPVPLTTLIDRERERTDLSALLQHPEVRLLTLTGTGGVGKTRLALEVARTVRAYFVDGVCFVPLATERDPERVIVAIAQALGLLETGDHPLMEQLQASLRARHLLLLLDNFEQVAAAAPLLNHLLASCPRLSILVTSRAALHLSGEHEFVVSPLELPALAQLPPLSDLAEVATVRLFVERARAVKTDMRLTESNARPIAEICVRLDGLPLAAARTKLLPPQALLTRLSQRFDLLTSGAQDLPARQQTLRNTLQWSYDLLTQEEQRLFRWLAIFVGGFTLEAATAVCNSGNPQPLDVFNGIASLLDKSLLSQTEQESGEPRFWMLETLREFGLMCLNLNGERVAAERAHASYYLTLAEDAEPHLMSSELVTWLDLLEREHENLRAVLQRAASDGDEQVSLTLRLSSALLHFWLHRWYPGEGRSFLEQGLAQSQRIPAPLRLKALIADGLLMWFQNDVRRLMPLAEEALILARTLEDQNSLAYSFTLQGIADMDRRSYAQARSHFEKGLSLARVQEDRFLMAFVLMNMGRMAMYQRQYSQAILLFKEGLTIYRALGNTLFIAILQNFLSHAVLRQGEIAQARTLMEENLVLARKAGIKWAIAIILSGLGQIAIGQGEMEKAEKFLSESIQLSQEMGDQRSMVRTRLLMAGLALQQGHDALAGTRYEESLAVAIEWGLASFIQSSLKGLGCVAAEQGQYHLATLLWGAAENVPESSSITISQDIYERMRVKARSHLGELLFTRALTEGHSMTPAQAFAAYSRASLVTEQPEVSSPIATKPTSAYPAGLTAREVEVLRLVAQGMTSPQIAEQLILSLHTVNAHMRSIYSKLGLNSRSAVTRYALEHQLL